MDRYCFHDRHGAVFLHPTQSSGASQQSLPALDLLIRALLIFAMLALLGAAATYALGCCVYALALSGAGYIAGAAGWLGLHVRGAL